MKTSSWSLYKYTTSSLGKLKRDLRLRFHVIYIGHGTYGSDWWPCDSTCMLTFPDGDTSPVWFEHSAQFYGPNVRMSCPTLQGLALRLHAIYIVDETPQCCFLVFLRLCSVFGGCPLQRRFPHCACPLWVGAKENSTMKAGLALSRSLTDDY